MATTLRFGSALSVIALATMVGGCSGLTAKSGRSAVASDSSKIGLITRAQLAMAGKDYVSAVNFAEQAVERTPNDASVRMMLGNVYFAAGRFASAEGAYRDSLSLRADQPQVVLKLALVQIAQGRNTQALDNLERARNSMDPSDYGLALALAGQVDKALAVLTERARQDDADAQVRQNLALAMALAGDWTNARIVASQDLTPDLVDQRIAQWMAFTKPASASSQVAALVGVVPDAADPGQPVRLALNSATQEQAVALADAAPVQQPAYEVAALQSPESTGISVAEAAPIETINVPPATPAAVAFAEAPLPAPLQATEAPAPQPSFVAVAKKAKRAAMVRASAKSGNRLPVRQASFSRAAGKSAAVVQLGAYGSPERVSYAWDKAAKRYSALRAYTPMSAKFASANGPVYRLSIKGFDSVREAQGLCAALRKSGGSCFVRSVAGDAPVRLASR
jgi:D-alanyl-D-alanine carboxypeptidase